MELFLELHFLLSSLTLDRVAMISEYRDMLVISQDYLNDIHGGCPKTLISSAVSPFSFLESFVG